MTNSSEPLSAWLCNHPELIDIIQIDSPENPEDTQATDQQNIDVIGKLTHFFNYTLLTARPEEPVLPKIGMSMPQPSVFSAHMHFFIQHEIFQQQLIAHERAINLCNELLENLVQILMSKEFVIKVSFLDLFRYLMNDNSTIRALCTKDSQVVSEISQGEIILTDLDNNISVLHQILYTMKQKFDRKGVYLPPHPLQARFNQFILHDKFVCKDTIDNILEDIQEKTLLRSCLRGMSKITSVLGLADSTDVTMFSIVFFRMIFGIANEMKPEHITIKQESEIRKYHKWFRVADTGAATELLPEFDPDDQISDVISRNEHLKAAAVELTSAAFHNSPLDILYSVHLCLANIRIAVAGVDAELAQSFDAIFGLFLLVLLGCDHPNPEEMFFLIDAYAPQTGLSGPLEYARSTVSASAMQCMSIIEAAKQRAEL